METAFFWLSKVVWYVISPESLLLLLVLAAWALLLRGALRWARRVLGFVAVVMIVLSAFPVGEWVLYPLETRFPTNPRLPGKIDGIIVLGGAEDAVRTAAWAQVEVNESAERFLASIDLARRYPTAKILFSSGSSNLVGKKFPGAEVARRLYAEQGVDMARVIIEGESRNTAENAALSKQIAGITAGQTWVLVTSASHMPRSVGIFCRAGWAVIPYPVDHSALKGDLLRIRWGMAGNIGNLANGIKEWVGLVAYFVTGRSSSLFPSGCSG